MQVGCTRRRRSKFLKISQTANCVRRRWHAVGGTAVCGTAVGGAAVGGTAFGGTAVGRTAVGGAAVGGAAVGGTAVGGTAVGGTTACKSGKGARATARRSRGAVEV